MSSGPDDEHFLSQQACSLSRPKYSHHFCQQAFSNNVLGNVTVINNCAALGTQSGLQTLKLCSREKLVCEARAAVFYWGLAST